MVKIKKENRALVFVCSIVHGGQEKFRWLYSFAESSGETLMHTILGHKYGKVAVLREEDASEEKLLHTLEKLGQNPEIHAIDMIMMVHGLPGKLYFKEGNVNVEKLGLKIQQLGIQPKLRLYYSTACFGATHALAMLEGGFDTAIGAIGENCNSATEYPTVLTMWAFGHAIKDCLAAGEIALTRIPADMTAKALGFKKANSDKEIFGNLQAKINIV